MVRLKCIGIRICQTKEKKRSAIKRGMMRGQVVEGGDGWMEWVRGEIGGMAGGVVGEEGVGRVLGLGGGGREGVEGNGEGGDLEL